MRFNEPAVGEKYKRVAQLLGLPEREANAAGVANAVSEMNARLGIPQGLGAMGLAEDTVEKITDGALRRITATSRRRASRPRRSMCS